MSSLGVRLQGVVAYKSLDHIGSNLWEVKNKRKFQNFSFKSGHSPLKRGDCLQEVPNKTIVTWLGKF